MKDSARLTPPLHPAPDIPAQQLTPMFAQYLSIKKEHEDALLFYRMGDFYELFFDDAAVASKALQIALTKRNSLAENPVPMCGVPHHSAEMYLSQLLEKGFKVAICEQMDDPKTVKGLVKRAVTMVRTPGTAVEDASLHSKTHNYLGALYWNREENCGGFAWLEYSTGEWSGLHSKREQELWQWVQKMRPRELLIPDLPAEEFRVPNTLSFEESTPVRLPLRGYFDLKSAGGRILNAQGIQELGAVGLNGKEELTRACGAILGYLLQTQKRDITHIKPFVPLNLSRHLIVDEITERNLEIFRRFDGRKGPGTLWHILDETRTSSGGRLLEERLRHPWRDLKRIKDSADVVAFFHKHGDRRAALRAGLDAVYDLERLSTRICLGRATPRDFVALRQSLLALAAIKSALENVSTDACLDANGGGLPSMAHAVNDKWDDLADIAALLSTALVDSPPPAITEGGLFRAGYNHELDELLDLLEHGQNRVKELLRQEQREYALPKLKLGYNRIFGYYFELPKTLADAVPEHFSRRQTVANAERYITPQLKDLEDKILAAGDSRKQLEFKLFQDLRARVADARPRILYMAESLAALDYWQCLAEVTAKWRWTRPELSDGADIVIREGRHPVIEAMAGPAGCIPNDLHMDAKRRLLLITGPNMSGKSTVLRQVAIIVILAQIGSFVPAAQAGIGLADRIFSRVGASDNLAQGQSTFMVEMMETARILRQASRHSIVILDEIGRGTSTFDGLSLAWAVVEDLASRAGGSIRTLFATHYHELTALEGRLTGVHNMTIAIREWEGEIIFLRRLVPGPSDRSYGIEVAKLAGVPAPVVQRAKKILENLEASRGGDKQRENPQHALLPGLNATERNSPQKPPLSPALKQEIAHPLCSSLRNLDTDNLTPMQALALITEWKAIWGGKE
ncbi:MAG: DNA mismatch repair protein MutS [Desulfovibrio sp.]|jgi:DNA mismatch repair protein MutS|nr:DNA mismatch repair protein MutS [Desulfovibrio sp.]